MRNKQRFFFMYCQKVKYEFMKCFILGVLISISTFSPSCRKSGASNCEGKNLNCGDIHCIAYWYYFDFTLTDKTTGEDLLFGSVPRYTLADVKLFIDAARTAPINIIADNVNKKLQCMVGRNEMYLEIKGTTVYKVNAEFKAVDCCSSRVKSLQVNNSSVCTCCADVIAVPVN